MKDVAIIVGASSGLGASLARRFAGEFRVALVARRQERLEVLAQEINRERGEDIARVYVHDVAERGEILPLFRRIVQEMGGCSLLIQAAGVLPPALNGVFAPEQEMELMDINTRGAVGWLSAAGAHMEAMGKGTLVGIGSVAGDRGRFRFPAYCASKAAVHIYLEGLRHRLAASGVRVVCIKPGPIESEMTQALGLAGAALEPSASAMERAIRRGSAVTYVPGRWRWIMAVIRHLPFVVFRRMRI